LGHSKRLRPPPSRTTAKLFPSGPQSAHWTFSSTARGAPPAMGARASVPVVTQVETAWLFNRRAISPEDESPGDETAMSSVGPSPRERDSTDPGRAVYTSIGSPCHVALYKIVCPSGANLAERIDPRRKVIGVYTGEFAAWDPHTIFPVTRPPVAANRSPPAIHKGTSLLAVRAGGAPATAGTVALAFGWDALVPTCVASVR